MSTAGEQCVPLVIRWSDCDPAGVVFHPNFLDYAEVGMAGLLARQGLRWRDLEERYDRQFPRVESRCRYLAPATYGDEIEVRLRLGRFSVRVMTVAFDIFRRLDGRHVAQGEIRFAVVARGDLFSTEVHALPLPPDLPAAFGWPVPEGVVANGAAAGEVRRPAGAGGGRP